MRNYWLRIVFGALGIFAVGMIVINLFDRGRQQVHVITHTDEPITIPIPGNLVGFSLAGERIGAIKRIKIMRSAVNRPESVEVQVALADSIPPERLGDCLFVVDELTRLSERTTFRCLAPADTAGLGLAPFGSILVRTAPTRPWPLLARAEEIARIQEDLADSAHSAAHRGEQRADSIRQAVELRADSIREAAEALADSVREAGLQSAEQAREGALP